MSVRKRRSGVWTIDVGRGASRLRHDHRGTYEEALALEKEFRTRRNLKQPKHLTINDITADYLKHASMYDAPTTFKEKKRLLFAHVLPFFGMMNPDNLTKQIIESYKQVRMETKKVKSIINELAILKAIIRWSVEHGISTNEFPRVRRLPYKPAPPTALTEDVIEKLIAHASPKIKLLLLLMSHAGLRKSEALTLTWEQIDLQNRCITIKGKGSKVRVCPITEMLATALSERHRGKWVLEGYKGKPMCNPRVGIATAKRKAGISGRIYPHMFRHSYATNLMDLGIDVRTIQELLGHSRITTTEIYTHVSMKRKHEAVSRLGSVSNVSQVSQKKTASG